MREGKVERNHLTLLAENDDRATATSSSSPRAGFLDGLHRGKPGVDLELLSRHAEGVIALTGCLASRFCQRLIDDRPDDARAHVDELIQVVRPRATSTSRSRRTGIAAQDKANEGIVRIAREVGRPLVGTGDVHYLRKRGLPPPHGAAVRADEVDARRAEDDLRHERVLPASPTRRWRARSPNGRRRSPSTLEIAERCDVEIELGKQLIPQLPDAGRRARGRVPARARRCRACASATATRRPGRGARADGDGARRDRPDGLQRLLPDRLGLRQVREGQRHRGRPGPRLGGRLDRRLLPAHHRRRPAPLRPAVRALPQPRARVDAGHRHRLLGARPRARDPLRDREVRRASRSRRSSRSARCSRARRRATPRACSATTTAPATGSRS